MQQAALLAAQRFALVQKVVSTALHLMARRNISNVTIAHFFIANPACLFSVEPTLPTKKVLGTERPVHKWLDYFNAESEGSLSIQRETVLHVPCCGGHQSESQSVE